MVGKPLLARRYSKPSEAAGSFTDEETRIALKYAESAFYRVNQQNIDTLDARWLSAEQMAALADLGGESFRHKWRRNTVPPRSRVS